MPKATDETLESSTSEPTTTPAGAPADNEQVPATKPEETVETTTSAVEAPEATEQSDADDAKPDPVQEVISKLARPDPAKPAEEKPSAPAKPEAKGDEPEAKAKPELAKPEKLDDDPLHGFSEQERRALKSKTEDRIRSLHRAAKEAMSRATGEENPIHKEFTSILDAPEIKPEIQFVRKEDLSDLIAVQAAINRSAIARQQGRRPTAADLETIKVAHEWMTGKVAGIAGIQPKAAPVAEIRPFDGKLPSEFQDLVDIHGLAEADVRLLAAIKSRQQAPPPQQATREAPPAAPIQPEPTGEGPDMEQVYHAKLIDAFTADGVPAARGEAHRRSLAPVVVELVQSRFPGTTKEDARGVFAALPPEDKFSFFLQAHQRVKVKTSPPARQSLAPATRAPVTGTAPRPSAPAASDDPVAAVVARLARPE